MIPGTPPHPIYAPEKTLSVMGRQPWPTITGHSFSSKQQTLVCALQKTFGSRQSALTHIVAFLGQLLGVHRLQVASSWLWCALCLLLSSSSLTVVPNINLHNLVNTTHYILVTPWVPHPTCVLPEAILAAESYKQSANGGRSLGGLGLLLSCPSPGTDDNQP